MKIFSAKPMPQEMVDAVAFCFGKPLSKWYCRMHFMTAPYIDVGCPHAGLDHVCDRRKNHKNRHHCWRCGLEIANDEQHYRYLAQLEAEAKAKGEQESA